MGSLLVHRDDNIRFIRLGDIFNRSWSVVMPEKPLLALFIKIKIIWVYTAWFLACTFMNYRNHMNIKWLVRFCFWILDKIFNMRLLSVGLETDSSRWLPFFFMSSWISSIVMSFSYKIGLIRVHNFFKSEEGWAR